MGTLLASSLLSIVFFCKPRGKAWSKPKIHTLEFILLVLAFGSFFSSIKNPLMVIVIVSLHPTTKKVKQSSGRFQKTFSFADDVDVSEKSSFWIRRSPSSIEPKILKSIGRINKWQL